jgi:hypothetical protein
MRTALIYPYIVPKAEALRPAFQRFVDTYQRFPAGVEHDLWLVACNGGEIAREDVRDIAALSYWRLAEYHGEGRDIGCHQHAANCLDSSYEFIVCCSSQVYFHREGWLKRMVEARAEKGPGMYGGMGSLEQGRPHLRTCFYGTDPVLFRGYPEVVNSRVKALKFESQPNYFLGWLLAQGMTGYMVAWDGIYGPESYRTPANVFRRGDQSNCISKRT